MNRVKYFGVLAIVLLSASPWVRAQTARSYLFKDLELRIDTLSYRWSENYLFFRGDKHLYFEYRSSDPVCELRFAPTAPGIADGYRLQPSNDYTILDSLTRMSDEYYQTKVRFNNLNTSEFINFVIVSPEGRAVQEFRVFHYTDTYVRFYPPNDDVYLGEEKVFELVTNNQSNLQIDSRWVEGDGIDYRLTESGNELRLHVVPKQRGSQALEIKLRTRRPYVDERGQLRYALDPISHTFNVKTSRLAFLGLSEKDVTLDEKTQREGMEVQIEDNRLLALDKTYRIEDREEKGGILIGELFTRRSLSNGRVLCWLRVFNFHRKGEGYLYLKDGDVAQFITNFNVTPKMTIETISILRDGADWTQSRTIRPGENIELRLEGKGFDKADFRFPEMVEYRSDTITRSETVAIFRLRVPTDISQKKIQIYNRNEPTGLSLNVVEYQRPHPLDFVKINYGDGYRAATDIDAPILYGKAIPDIVIAFDQNRIDSENRLYGKQFLTVEARITTQTGTLVEIKTVENILICPGDNSPRSAFYTDRNCRYKDINLNEILSRKTYDLDGWSRVQLTIRHDKEKYGGDGFEQKIELILSRRINFDIDLSFPAGLLTFREGQGYVGGFGGISLATIAQFSFFQPGRIARYQPYRIGAGFLAFNAFAFNESANRDFGIVVLGSVFPTRRDLKLSFPLYVGGGYYLTDNATRNSNGGSSGRWFFLLGPGIRVQL